LSTTGLAGPGGGTKKTPVGRVFVAISDGKKTLVEKETFKGSRRAVKRAAAERSLQLLYDFLTERRMQMRQLSLHQQIEALTNFNKSSIFIMRKGSQGISQGHGRLGIFPASFNPPTRAHLALIRNAMRFGHLDEILVLLDARAMDKKIIGAGLEDRVIMLKKIFQRDPRISIGISNRGLFIEKLAPLRRLYPFAAEFIFVAGFDTILRVLDRKYYEAPEASLDGLCKRSSFLVANRGELDQERFETLLEHSDNTKFKKKISFFVLPKRFSSISSSLVRERLREGKPIDDLVPSPILRFIEETGLYTKKE
jgi:nicotinate (nicotinamide) nucleotide adenylyltransferase